MAWEDFWKKKKSRGQMVGGWRPLEASFFRPSAGQNSRPSASTSLDVTHWKFAFSEAHFSQTMARKSPPHGFPIILGSTFKWDHFRPIVWKLNRAHPIHNRFNGRFSTHHEISWKCWYNMGSSSKWDSFRPILWLHWIDVFGPFVTTNKTWTKCRGRGIFLI
jgi:hypothetical protein